MATLQVILLFMLLSWNVQDASAKPNVVSKLLNEFLSSLLEGNLTIPEIELGSRDNRLTDIVVYMDDFNKTLDGLGSFGFKLTAGATNVHVTGNYDFDYLDVPKLFPFFGKGRFSVHLSQLQINLNLQAKQNFVTDKFEVTIPVARASVDNSSVFFENLMNHPHVADFLNELISSLVPDVFAVFEEILNFFQPVIEYLTNEVITCIRREMLTGKIKECIGNITMPESVSVFNVTKFVNVK